MSTAVPPEHAVKGHVRLDLQGVRALAVIVVALNHARISALPGGYFGVDVFFVLSGYFITGQLLRDGLANGRVSIIGFYGRRARRILPAACLTLITTSIAVYVIYDVLRHDYPQTRPVLMDALSASLFFANIHLSATATNYFAQASATLPTPVLHFWSLSVEEQFYVVWPSLMAGLLWLGWRSMRRGKGLARARRNSGRLLATALIVAIAASLVWAAHGTADNPTSTYFSTFARVWELGLGAGVALLAARPVRAEWLARLGPVAGWVGLAMIVVPCVCFTGAQTGFNVYRTLIPVAGTAVLILAGLRTTRLGADRVLALAPCAYVGDRSYTFYLWHYPALVLVWQVAGRTLSAGANVGILAGAFLLSMLTFKFYETPLRFARWLRGWRTAGLAAVSLGGSLAAILIPVAIVDGSLAAQAAVAKQTHVASLAPATSNNLTDQPPIPAVKAAVSAAKRKAPLPASYVPSMAQLQQENTSSEYGIPDGCQPAWESGTSSQICKLGDASATRTVVVFGDSHAQMWMSALEKLGTQDNFAVVPLEKAGCFIAREDENLPGWPCETWFKWAVGQDKKLKPIATIVGYRLDIYAKSRFPKVMSELQSVFKHVTNPVYLADPPGRRAGGGGGEPAVCLSQTGANQGTCSFREAPAYAQLMRDVSKTTSADNIPALPTAQWFCADKICPMLIDNMVVTHDGDHLTEEYSTALAPLLGAEFEPILASR
jgi:peptidoglycan/LPS O-acetylase OafA/YrhL